MTNPQPIETDPFREMGDLHIKPSKVPADWPSDFFAPRMAYGSTTHMTQGQKSVEYRRRALYSALRSIAYDKVRDAALAKTRRLRLAALAFALVWGAGVLAWHFDQLGEVAQGVSAIGSMAPALRNMESLAE